MMRLDFRDGLLAGLAPAALGGSSPAATTMLAILLTAGGFLRMRRIRCPVLARCGDSAQDLEPRSHANLPGRGERRRCVASQMPRERPAGKASGYT
jgi:hypothetical protein